MGKKLLNEFLKENKGKTIVVRTLEKNLKAKKLYKNFGFKLLPEKIKEQKITKKGIKKIVIKQYLILAGHSREKSKKEVGLL